jgi:hypothetical protein
MKKGKNHSPKSSYAWKDDKMIKKDCCYECGSTEDIQYHHIIPESKGGKETIPLCIICHGKVHDVDFVKMKELQKEGIEKAKQKRSRQKFFENLPKVLDTLNYVLLNVNPKNERFKSFDDYISYVVEKAVFLHFLKCEPSSLEETYPNLTKEVRNKFLIDRLGKKYDEILEFKNYFISDEEGQIKKIYDSGLPGTIKNTRSDLLKYFE